MLLQLEREFLQADLAQVRTLLSQSPPDEDPIEHFQFTHRAQELEAKLAAMPQAIESAAAGVALFFGGRPVVGSHGIQCGLSRAICRRDCHFVSLLRIAGSFNSKKRI